MMDLMTVGIFSGCFLVVLSLVWLLSFLTKEQSYEDGLRQQKGGRLAALGVNKNSKEEGGKNRHDKRQAKQQDKPAKAKKQVQQVVQPIEVEQVEPTPAEQPVEAPATAVHLTAAGKAKAKKEHQQPAAAKSNKMTIEEVDAAAPKPVEAVQELPERVPVVEPIIVKEEATLLYEEKVQGSGGTGTSTPTAQQSTPVSGSRQKKKQRGGGGGGGGGGAGGGGGNNQSAVQPQDLMTAVRKTNFDDEELQNLIDILLNKQQNCPPSSVNGSWVDPQTNEMKQLQRTLQDREMQLEVEQARVKDMSGRYQQLQRELAESKNQMQRLRNDFQGQINGLERAKIEAEQSFANVSHRQSYDIQNLNHQNQELVRQINELNGHLAVYRTRPAPEDVKAEMEQAHSNELNNLHSQLSHRSNELASAKQQVQELRSQMEGSEALSMELSKAKEQAKSLEKKCSMLQQNNQMLQTQNQDNTKNVELQSRIEVGKDSMECCEDSESSAVTVTADAVQQGGDDDDDDDDGDDEFQELTKSKGSLEQSLKTTADHLTAARAEMDTKVAQWEEEKKALTEKVQVNGKAEHEAAAAEAEAATKRQEEEFVSKLNQVLKEKEALVQKISTDQQQLQTKVSEADSLRTELESVKGQLKDAASSLDQQRAKNDEDKSSIVKQTEERYITFLARLFADVDFSAEESQWKSGVEAHIQSLKDKPAAAAEQEATNESSEEIEKLEKQVNHYKSSLQETETLLHKLQASVEAEEAKWKQSLSDQQKELDALKEQNAKMESCVQSAEEKQHVEPVERNFAIGGQVRPGLGRRMVPTNSVTSGLQPQSTFECSFDDDTWSMVNYTNSGLVVTSSFEGQQPESLTGVSFACAILEKAILDADEGSQGNSKEMQEKLQQLQSQLIGHEAAKRDLEKTLAERSDCELEEKQKLIQEIESLKEGKVELGLQVARMNQLVTAGQEALQQEQKTADLLREQLAKVKETPECKIADNSTNNEDGNGSSLLTAKSPQSSNNACTTNANTAKTPTLGSVASLDLSANDHPTSSPTTSDDKKKKKKKLLGLIKINK